MAHLVTYLSQCHDVTLMTLESADQRPFYTLPPNIRIVRANLLGERGVLERTARVFARFGAIRGEIRLGRPHVVLSFLDTMNIATIVACFGRCAPLVISERVDPSAHDIGAAKTLIRRLLYPLADCCVVQTERVKDYFDRPPRPRITVIPNPVSIPTDHARPAMADARGRFRIVTLGRLETQKRFDLLIDAFSLIAGDFPAWELIIFGEGSLRGALEGRVRRLELESAVRLPGVTDQVTGELLSSHLMAFPSHFEGFPNALAEALAAGLPAIGCVGVSGVEELICDSENGILLDLTDDAPRWAEALARLMGNASLRERYGAQARRHIQAWRLETICGRWEQQLEAVARHGDTAA